MSTPTAILWVSRAQQSNQCYLKYRRPSTPKESCDRARKKARHERSIKKKKQSKKKEKQVWKKRTNFFHLLLHRQTKKRKYESMRMKSSTKMADVVGEEQRIQLNSFQVSCNRWKWWERLTSFNEISISTAFWKDFARGDTSLSKEKKNATETKATTETRRNGIKERKKNDFHFLRFTIHSSILYTFGFFLLRINGWKITQPKSTKSRKTK